MTSGASLQGVVVWFTGLPSSGKTSLAGAVARALQGRGVASCTLDGDEVRACLRPEPGYGEVERELFYTTLGNLAAMLARQGFVVLVPATANRRLFREHARGVAPRFVEVHVSTPEPECVRRDAKGLYGGARAGRAQLLPGRGALYEPPLSPDVVAPSGADAQAVGAVLAALEPILS